MKTYNVQVRYTGTATVVVEASTAYEAKRKSRELLSPCTNIDFEDMKDFKWSTAKINEIKE